LKASHGKNSWGGSFPELSPSQAGFSQKKVVQKINKNLTKKI
jgi:hypothetical protein